METLVLTEDRPDSLVTFPAIGSEDRNDQIVAVTYRGARDIADDDKPEDRNDAIVSASGKRTACFDPNFCS